MSYIRKEDLLKLKVIRPQVVICGAGHVSLTLAFILDMLGYDTSVIDNRPGVFDEWPVLNVKFCPDDFADALCKLNIGDNAYYVVATYGHEWDYECLSKICGRQHGYIGLLSSKSRGKEIRERLIAEGFDTDVVESIHSPIGIAIEADSPQEIAVAIAAELIDTWRRTYQKKSDNSMKCAAEASESKDLAVIRTCGEDSKEVLISMTSEISSMIRGLRNKAVLAVITGKEGSSPRKCGTCMLIEEDGHITGTIGGGVIEKTVTDKAIDMLKASPESEAVRELNLESHMPGSDMKCGGSVKVELHIVM